MSKHLGLALVLLGSAFVAVGTYKWLNRFSVNSEDALNALGRLGIQPTEIEDIKSVTPIYTPAGIVPTAKDVVVIMKLGSVYYYQYNTDTVHFVGSK